MDLYETYSRQPRHSVLTFTLVMIAAIALADWRIRANISMGVLYFFPILMGAGRMRTLEIVAVATLSAGLREWLGPYDPGADLLPRVVILWIAYCGSGLLVQQFVRSRSVDEQAQRDLVGMIESSPLPMLIAGADRQIISANRAAGALFACSHLAGRPIADFIPTLTGVPVGGGGPIPRTMVECRAISAGGRSFPARVWFSVYGQATDARLAAVVLDVSEDFREREEAGLDAVLSTSGILVSAVFHEIRNTCTAIRLTAERLAGPPHIQEAPEYRALLGLTSGLEELASTRLQVATAPVQRTDIPSVIADLQTVLDPMAADQELAVVWNIESSLPQVRGDRHKLLQVLLNLVNNSLRALEHSQHRVLEVSAGREGAFVQITIQDSGPGVKDPALLFRPFVSAAESTGLGLYISRIVMRSFGGDLVYRPNGKGATFTLRIPAAH